MKILQVCYIGDFGYSSLQPTKKYPFVEIFYADTQKNSTWSLTPFLRYYTLRNLALWLTRSILTHKLKTGSLPKKGFCNETYNNKFRVLPGKTDNSIFQKMKKKKKLFGSFWGKTEFFSKFCSDQLFSLLTRYNGATFKKKLIIRFQAK